MSTTNTDKELDVLSAQLKDIPLNMRLFSLSMRSLYAENAVGTQTAGAQKFRALRDATRVDAVGYLKGVLPVTVKVVSSIADYFDYYEALSMDEWWGEIDYIISEAEKYRSACAVLVKMHEAIMVSLKKREDEAKVLVLELGDLAARYNTQVAKLRQYANEKHIWALALLFIPFVNLIACPILSVAADQELALAVAKEKEASIDEAAALVVSNTLIPAIENFINGLSKIAGFFEIVKVNLVSFKRQGEGAIERGGPSVIHYKVMKHKAREIKGGCRGFYAILPDVRTDFEAIPTEGTNQNYVDKWLAKQKKIIEDNCTIKVLAKRLINMIEG